LPGSKNPANLFKINVETRNHLKNGENLKKIQIVKIMKKKLSLLVLALIMLIGCSKDDPKPKPDASFTYEKVIAAAKDYNEMKTYFTNTSEDAVSYSWDFGDGTTSTDINPEHIFPANGNYNVTLSATNSGGTTTYSKQVNINYGQVVFYITLSGYGSVAIYPNNQEINWQYDFGNITTVCTNFIPSAWYQGCFTYTEEAGTYTYEAQDCNGNWYTSQYQVIAGQCKPIKIF